MPVAGSADEGRDEETEEGGGVAAVGVEGVEAVGAREGVGGVVPGVGSDGVDGLVATGGGMDGEMERYNAVAALRIEN